MGLSLLNLAAQFVKNFILFIFFHLELHFGVLFWVVIDCLDHFFSIQSLEVVVIPALLERLECFPILPNCLSELELRVEDFKLRNIPRWYIQSLLKRPIHLNFFYACRIPLLNLLEFIESFSVNCVFVHQSVTFYLVDQIYELLLLSLDLARKLFIVYLFLLNDFLFGFGDDCSNCDEFNTD